MAAESIFIDTNVLVFASAASAPMHEASRTRLQSSFEAGCERWISRQVVREYLATMTRPQLFSKPLPGAQLLADIAAFEKNFFIADDDAETMSQLLALVAKIPVGGKQIHDANIVATMRAFGIPRLLTCNPGDFARFSGLIEIETP